MRLGRWYPTADAVHKALTDQLTRLCKALPGEHIEVTTHEGPDLVPEIARKILCPKI